MQKQVVAGVVIVGAVVFAMFAVAHYRERDRANGPAELRALVTLGDTMLVHEEVYEKNEGHQEWTRRLSVVGVADGKVRARVVIGPDAIACGPSIPGRIWCARDTKVELRDASTLAVVADDATITKALGAPLSDWSSWVDLRTGELFVHTKDDRDVAISDKLQTRPRNRDKADDGWLVLEQRSPRSSAKAPESGGVHAAFVGKPPVLVGTDVKTLREIYRYDGTLTK
jgi:hypothetical protein